MITQQKRVLRDYQKLAIEHTLKAVQSSQERGFYYTLPTGTGKTRILTGLIDHFHRQGRVLAIAHRKELIEQMALAIVDDIAGADVGIMMADRNEAASHVVVGSVQTLRPDRLEQYLSCSHDDVRAVLIDEAHHVTADNSYAALIEQVHATYPDAAIIGCTATAYRADKATMQDKLPICTFSRSIPDMQAAGWLSPVSWSPLKIALELDRVKTSSLDGEKDYSGEQLAEQLSPQSRYIAHHTKERIGSRPTLAFCCSVRHAQELAQAYNAEGLVAFPIWGNMPKSDREEVLDLWKKGEVQVVTNVGVLTEGFDYQPRSPNRDGLSALVIARPTMSPALYLQMLGRGTRIKPQDSSYQDCLVLDCVGNANLLETKQITLPRVMPTVSDDQLIGNTIKERKESQETRPHTLRINDPLSVSWLAWAYDPDSRIYYTGLVNDHYAAIIPDPAASGLYYAFHYEKRTQPIRDFARATMWIHEQIVPSAKPLSEIMQHVNHVISQNGLKSIMDKEAKWRTGQPSAKQLDVLKRMDRQAYMKALDFGWTKGEVSQHLNWLFLRPQVVRTLKGLQA